LDDVEADDVELQWWYANDVEYPEPMVGPDGTPVFYNSDIAAIGAIYYLSDPANPVGPRRYIIDPDDVQEGQITDVDDINFDNLAPEMYVDDIVAFNDFFDEWWVKADYDFVANDIDHDEEGVGFVTEQAFDWAGPDTDDCALATVMLTTPDGRDLGDGPGTPLDETLVSDGDPDGYRLCAFGYDALMNSAWDDDASNFYGVDMHAPQARIWGDDSSDALPVGFTAPIGDAEGATPVSDVMGETVYGTANMFGTGDFHYNTRDITMAWGLDAIDDRAGLDDYTGYPFIQNITYYGPAVYLPNPCTTEVTAASPFPLTDNWRRVNGPTDFLCAIGDPGRFMYEGYAVDRAGNQSTHFTYNYVVDELFGAEIAAVTLNAVQYTPGAPGAFNVFGSDDLEIVKAQLGLYYPTALGQLTLWYAAQTLADGGWDDTWLTTLSPQIMTVNPIFGRMDFTQPDGSLLGTTQAFNDAIGEIDGIGVIDNADALPTAVVANLPQDAGFNPEENADVTAAFVPFGFNGWTATTTPPWPDANIEYWNFQDDVVNSMYRGQQTGDSSLDAWVFDLVLLVLNDGGEIHVCGATTSYVYTDNGINRFYTYSFPYPTGEDICGVPPVGSTFHMVGVKGNALLVTLESSAPVPPPAP
jgi:hypothetical protein